MNRFWSILFFLVPILGVGICLMSAFGIYPLEHTWLPADISESGKDIDFAFNLVMWIIGIVFVGTGLILAMSMWSYPFNADRKATYSHGNTKLEIIWSVIPGVVLIGIFIFQAVYWERQKINQPVVTLADGTTALQQPIVKVVARKFGWRFWYAGLDGELGTSDDFVLENELHLPMDEPLVVQLESEDVLHSFFLRNLRIKQDLIPGKKQFAWFTIVSEKIEQDKVYDILCAELCGWGHARMNGRLYPKTKSDFQEFLKLNDLKQNGFAMNEAEEK
jgi:cytochrome c oxidase subunit 2